MTRRRPGSTLQTEARKNTRGQHTLKLIVQTEAQKTPIQRPKQIPGYMGFTRGKKCIEKLPQEYFDPAVSAHMEDLSTHLNTAIHSGFNADELMPKKSVLQEESVPAKILMKQAERTSRSAKHYNVSKGNIPGYGSFSR